MACVCHVHASLYMRQARINRPFRFIRLPLATRKRMKRFHEFMNGKRIDITCVIRLRHDTHAQKTLCL